MQTLYTLESLSVHLPIKDNCPYKLYICSMNSLISSLIYMYTSWFILKANDFFFRKYINLMCHIKQSTTTSILSSASFMQLLLFSSSITCFEFMHMEKNTFILLCQWFRENGWLSDCRYLVVEENMTMFLITLRHNLRNRLVSTLRSCNAYIFSWSFNNYDEICKRHDHTFHIQ